MDLRGIANGIASSVNNNMQVNILRSTGYVNGNGGKQIPQYANPVSQFAQLQPLNSDQLRQMDGLNVQGIMQTISLRGQVTAANRPKGTGGDIIKINGEDWLVVRVLESWPMWTKAIIKLQGGE